ncbi:YqcC family protein [Halopseudomonas salegens]|uniref:YqcC family protein n=1 Tax=Halopseudomonas salegens TaxID=1434072 RepID=UPI001E2CA344|nr:YqcC family protein [Halopseudomonas salegens]
MSPRRRMVRQHLEQLEQVLRQLGLWSQQPPEPDYLASQTPFCADTLAFEEWLQWVFIPRVNSILDRGEPLPDRCALRPMGEQALMRLGRRRVDLLVLLGQIDHQVQSAQ